MRLDRTLPLRLLLPLLLLVLLASCQKTRILVSSDYRLTVVETTDIHGYIVSNQNGTIHYRLAYIADKVNDIRSQGGSYDEDRLLLLDGGDLYQGASVSNLLGGRPIYTAMDKMGYDAVALGNHEFDWQFSSVVDPDATLPDYEQDGRRCVNEVPVLCANLYKDGKRDPSTKDYVIVEKTASRSDGSTVKVRVGVIGFAVDYASSIMTSKFTDLGYSIREDYSMANNLAASLESSGQCDATVLLIHGAADRAAENLGLDSPIDLVLGGHSHATKNGRSSAGRAYLQAGRYGERYARADLRFKVDDTGKVSFHCVDKQQVEAVDATRDLHEREGQNANDLDETVLTLSDEALAATQEQLGSVVGFITVNAHNYSLEGSGGRASVMANWMSDIMRRIGGADVAFVNGGGVRTSFPLDGQSRRNITVANVYEMFPFNNDIYVYELTYAELLKVLEYALTNAGSSLFTTVTGIDCHYRDYAVRSLVKNGTVIYQGKQWTGDWASRTVRLAVSEYLATNQRVDDYSGKGNPLPGWNETPRLLIDNLLDNEHAIRVLREEAAASGGHLFLDLQPHFIAD